MNILFIEDEKELAVTGVEQLELKGYTVFLAYDIAEALAILDDSKRPVHFVITDHSLPDGLGIPLVINLKTSMPHCKCAVVSGCLTDADIEELKGHGIPYFLKPLLYVKVIDELRRLHASHASKHVEPEPEPEPEESEAPPEETKSKLRKFWPFK